MIVFHYSLFFLLLDLSKRAVADLPPFVADDSFEKGLYGLYPSQTFVSSDLRAPRPNLLQHSARCQDGLFTLLAPRGNAVSAAPMILDHEMNMVWSSKDYESVYNLRVQEYNGEQFLTFWSGDDSVRGHGSGEYHVVCSLTGLNA